MIRLLRWLITGDGHVHKWKIIHAANLVASEDSTLPYGASYHLKCEHCGDVKIRELK